MFITMVYMVKYAASGKVEQSYHGLTKDEAEKVDVKYLKDKR